MHVRPARLDDIPAMHRLRLEVRENTLAEPPAITEPSYLPFLTGGGAGWVAEADDGVAGFAIVDTATNNVWALFVDPAAEGRGIGRALLDAMLAWVAAQGIDRLWLTTAAGTRAERFYEQAGWARTGRAENGEVRFELVL